MEGGIVVICSLGTFFAHAGPCYADSMIKVPYSIVKKLQQSQIYVLAAEAIPPCFLISLSAKQGGGFAFLPNAYT